MRYAKLKSCLVALSLICFSVTAYSAPIMLTNGEWAPWLSQDLKHLGVGSHIVSEAFKKAGMEVKYGFFPWKRAFELAKKGEWDGSVIWSKSAEREQDFVFSDPIVSSKTVFFHLKTTNFDWSEYTDLKGKTVGITTGYFYSDGFKKAEDDGIFKTTAAASDEVNFKKLLSGRIDLFPADVNVGYYLLNNKFSAEQVHLVAFHAKSLKEVPYHVILSKKSPNHMETLSKLNSALKEMASDGTIESYLDNSRQGKYKK